MHGGEFKAGLAGNHTSFTRGHKASLMEECKHKGLVCKVLTLSMMLDSTQENKCLISVVDEKCEHETFVRMVKIG